MSCIKNLSDRDPRKWIAAGCPLPTMMHLERRKGKEVPVIKKALVELDGQMFKSYVAIRDKWALLDCFRSPGPIQFSGPSSDIVNFLVKPPVIEEIVRETEEHEKFENSTSLASHFHRDRTNLSELSAARIQDVAEIPDTLELNAHAVVPIKKYKAFSQLVRSKISEQFPNLQDYKYSSYFVEIQNKLLLDNDLGFEDNEIKELALELVNFVPN